MNEKAEAGHLFDVALTKLSAREIASGLCVCAGTVNRWIKQNEVPPFYKNDLRRILNKPCDVGVYDSDQFYTLPEAAKACLREMVQTLRKYNTAIDEYVFVEPSAGCGHFYDQLPKNKRVGIDIDPQKSPLDSVFQDEIIKADFLKWEAPKGKYIVIGNPPFGRNGKTALDFVLKSFQFADFVGFILPPIFESTGKGSCRNRLTALGYALLHTKPNDDELFVRPDGSRIGVKTVFQVWAKNAPKGYRVTKPKSCDGHVEIYNLYQSYKPSRPSSRVYLIGKCDVYIPRSFWKSADAKASLCFNDIPYKDGYGLIAKKNKKRLVDFVMRFDWGGVAHTSTNGSKSLRKDIIKEQLIKHGFADK